jgi:hypothetical protein
MESKAAQLGTLAVISHFSATKAFAIVPRFAGAVRGNKKFFGSQQLILGPAAESDALIQALMALEIGRGAEAVRTRYNWNR